MDLIKSKYSFLGFLLLLIGCTSDEPIKCGCDGSFKEELREDPGIMVKTYDGSFDGFRFLSLQYGILELCADVPPELQVDGLQVRISGSVNIPCKVSKDPVQFVQHYPFHMSSFLIAPDSLFTADPVAIQIFPVQGPQSSGFGYSVITSYGLKIRQEFIPVVEGFQTFSTATKAFKVAVLVGHKTTVSNGLPTLIQYDLLYLQVLGN